MTPQTYIETGLGNGWKYWESGCQSPSSPSSCIAYAQYWADTTPAYGQSIHTIANVTPTGLWNNYQISRASTVNQMIINLDNTTIGLSTHTDGHWEGIAMTAGGELSTPSVTSPSGSFADTTQMQLKWVDYLSGIHTQGAPNYTTIDAATYGFNGVQYNPGDWWWNKITAP